MRFAHPHALWLLALVPALVVAYAVDGQIRRRTLQRIGHLPQLLRMTAQVSTAGRRWKEVLNVLAIGCVVVGLAGPQWSSGAHLAPRRGLDIVVALDFSRSMLATDVYPTRLARAKRELDQLIDNLKGDRVGLVAFAGVSMSYPLTNDYSAAKLFWRDLGPDDVPVGGTNLAGALRDSLELLEHGGAARKRSDGRPPPAQVIVLLTDGADTEGGSLELAREAARRGVKVYTVGIGTAAGDFVPLHKKQDGTVEYIEEDGRPVRMQLDAETLRQIASITGGDYFPVDPARFGVDRVQRAIATLERAEEDARVVRDPEEAYWLVILGALGLLFVEGLLGERRAPRPAAARPQRRAAGGGEMAALVLLVACLPGLTAFDFFLRENPEVQEGNQKLQAGRADEALAAYDRALAARPDDPIIHYDRGAALYALGRLADARAEFQRAAEAGDSDPSLRADALYNMGNALLRQERAKDALDAYKRTLGLRPDDRRAKWNLELALRKLREEEQKKQPQNQQNQNQQNQNQQQQQQQQADAAKQQQDAAKQQQDATKLQQDAAKQQQDAAKQQTAVSEPEPAPEPPPAPTPTPTPPPKPSAPKKDIDRQDAEAVLDAFERVEPTVQKDLARRRAGNRRPRRDW